MPQQDADGGGKIRGYAPGGSGFLGPGNGGWNQDGACTGGFGCLYVCANVPDHGHFPGLQPQALAGAADHSRLGFAAAAAILRTVRTDFPDIERAQQFIHAGVDGGHLGWREQSACYPGLVADHPRPDSLPAKCPQRCCRAGKGDNQIRVAVILDVAHQCSVPVEEHRPRPFWLLMSHKELVPHPHRF